MTNDITSSAVPGSLLVPNTPRSQKSFGRDVGVVQLRPVIAREMDGEFLRCPVDTFFKTYLPFAPDPEVTNSFVKKLLQETPPGPAAPPNIRTMRSATKFKPSILTGTEDQYQFREYPKPNITRGSHSSEIVAYQGWFDIAQAIGNLGYPNDTRTRNKFNYQNMPNKLIFSDVPGSNNLIDAALIRPCEETEDLRTTDIAVVIEQKLPTSLVKRRENSLQAVSANVQIMNDDVRRMFTFGITVESDSVTLWYHSRSHSAVSERFSFTQNPNLLIRVLIAFLYARDEELGYDLEVTREKDGHYTFKIPDPDPLSQVIHRYRTVKTISEYRSNNITGRMARVYEVTKLNEKGEAVGDHLVLKDVWLDASAKTEKEIQNDIFKHIEAFWENPTEHAEFRILQEKHRKMVADKLYKQHFLHIVHDYTGKTTTTHASGAGVKIENGILLGHEPPVKAHTQKGGTGSVSSLNRSEAGEHTRPIYSTAPAAPTVPRNFEDKKQYRVVFKEVCVTVGKLGTLGEVVDVLQQTLIPLQLLFCAGWVHRDISSGNILAYRNKLDNADEPWKVKLSDLEYAKKFPPPNDYEAAADPKTGTPYFMPLEIMRKAYLFSIEQVMNMTGNRSASIAEMASGADSETVSDTPFHNRVIHNFQHDLESLWWILLWTITCRIDSTVAFAYGRPIFVNHMTPTEARNTCFSAQGKLVQELKKFMPPSEARINFSSCMEALRKAMCLDYTQRVGAGNHLKPEHYVRIHEDFDDTFNLINTTALEWSATVLIIRKATDTIEEESVVPGRKRDRTTEDAADTRQADGESRAKLARMDESLEGEERE